MNFEIRKLEDEIISILNASGAPIEAKRLILTDLLNVVTKKADEIISQEIIAQKGEKEK